MIRNWLSGKKDTLVASSSSNPTDRLQELHNLEATLEAANLIFNDDLDGAADGLSQGNSSFHLLGRALIQFIRASLGIEADVMQKAADLLSEAEASFTRDLRRAQKDPNGDQSAIYSVGTEFALGAATCQLMSAIVAIFKESVVEGFKGFLKINAAYKTLQKIVDSEEVYLSKKTSTTYTIAKLPGEDEGEKERDVDEFYDANEETSEPLQLQEYRGKFELADAAQTSSKLMFSQPNIMDSNDLKSPMDAFIHSGTNLCYGMLSLMLSLVPPALSKLLGLIGYKGDRRRGIRMLWSSSRNSNAMGALAGLVLLAYYNGIIGSVDIMPLAAQNAEFQSDEDIDGYPAEQLADLLVSMRKRFPLSKIWTLESARMLAAQQDLKSSLQILEGDFESPFKQVEALAIFEKGLQSLYSHEHSLCTSSFKESCQRNNWSHSLYLYIAAISQVELYRLAKSINDQEGAKKYSTEATKLLHEAKDKVGRRKTFGRQLPFDAFVAHKLAKWNGRVAAQNIALIDAIGVSPSEEMIFLWNGYRKMPPSYLETSLERIAWIEESNPNLLKQDINERVLFSLIRAVILRSLGQYEDARSLLKEHVLGTNKQELKVDNNDDWVLPAAHYEMAVNLWESCYRQDPATESVSQHTNRKVAPAGEGEHAAANKKLMQKAQEWLEKAAAWESYLLDARLGLRINTGLDTVKSWRLRWDK